MCHPVFSLYTPELKCRMRYLYRKRYALIFGKSERSESGIKW